MCGDEDLQGGTLYVVATPIGHLGDLSDTAKETLAAVDLVACEDTRRTGRLLKFLGLHKKLVSLHEHNESSRSAPLRERLAAGETIALVSDAGTPLVSDPGYRLVRDCIADGHPVIVVPGPSAVLAALIGSGLPPHPFTFVGFPPPKRGKRRTFFGRFADLHHTVVFFESPHRLLASLEDALEVFGDRQTALARELTKLHEETLRGTLGEILESVRERGRLKGEIVVTVAGHGP